tara:strand:+ start:81 stop:263 length:183 start_codon:yes stop_codon:yes gene_type:complete
MPMGKGTYGSRVGRPAKKKAAKKALSPKQKKIARVASPANKITGADFKGLKNAKKSKKRR